MDTLNVQMSRPRHISPEEWAVRVDLAACYRLVAHFGWDDLILTHNSARVPGEPDHMLINPMGLMFNEVTASNILKVDFDGNLVEPSEYEPIYAGVVIHGAIYLGRPDVECVIHTHTEADIAVGVPRRGCCRCRNGRCGSTNGSATTITRASRSTWTSAQRLQQSIGNHPVLVLRNHGLLATGRNVAEAFSLTYHFERAAEAQLKAQAACASGAKAGVPAGGDLPRNRRRSSPPWATRRASAASANGRRCCGCATSSTRASAPERPQAPRIWPWPLLYLRPWR